ncbi:MAG TPA: alkaline phosphatase family protein [Acidobacteriota bacterium]|jgi:hypothetical protein
MQNPNLSGRIENAVLITADGLRHQEFFAGAADDLLRDKKSGIESPDLLRDQFWRPTAEERRNVLLPFFWESLASRGAVFGNRKLGSRVDVSNAYRVSYPGYAEILTGQAQPSITGNKAVPSPRETVLEFVRRKLNLSAMQVVAFGSWSFFRHITAHKPGAIFCNSGYEAFPHQMATPLMDTLSSFQQKARTAWDTVRHDAVTAGLALEYLGAYRPRLLYLAMGETDDWAHDRRYDRVLQSIKLFDDTLRELWTAIQLMDNYRDKTALIITSDHGRGATSADWTDHGAKVPGANEIWLAVITPGTQARGEVSDSGTIYQNQVAATLLTLLGLDDKEFNPNSGKPIPLG